jgi:hypothetical protein
MDTLYESLTGQVADDRPAPDVFDIKEATERDEQRQKLLWEIAALETKVRRERLFNRQGELKRLCAELEGL